MTTHAVTAQAVHATLEDLGYQKCEVEGTDHEGYRWSGRKDCPRCDTNPNLIPRKVVGRKTNPEIHVTRPNNRKRPLSDEQVIEARRLYWIEDWTDTQLAEKFGAERPTMYGVATGKSYKDLPMPPEKVRRERNERRKKANRKPVCINGHEIAKVGRTPHYTCKACQSEYNKGRYQKRTGEG